jgi:hypothetical protein
MPTVTLRPTADGAILGNRIYPTTPTTHYDKVDEETPNDLTDYVYGGDTVGAYYMDTYVKPSSGIPAGSTINSVTIYNRILTPPGEAGTMGRVATLLRNAAGVLAAGTNKYARTWTTISTVYASSPFTGAAWTLAEVEGLQIGTRTLTNNDAISGPVQGMCSTVWLVIDYTPPPPVGVPRFIGDGLAVAVIIAFIIA